MTSEPNPSSPAEAERIRAITQNWFLFAASVLLIPLLMMLINSWMMLGMPVVFVITLLLMIGLVLFAAILICLAWRRGSRFAPILASIFIAAQFVLATGLAVPNYRKARCGAWQLVHGVLLRSIGMSIHDELAAGKDLPPSIVQLLLDRGTLYESFNHPCGSCRYRDVIIGRYTLADYLDGRVTRGELDAEAVLANTDPHCWERLGNIVVSRYPELWRSSDYALITAYGPVGGDHSYGAYNILYADGHCEVDYAHKPENPNLPNLIHSIARARTLNLPEPPQDFLDAFGITEEQITAHIAAQELPSGETTETPQP